MNESPLRGRRDSEKFLFFLLLDFDGEGVIAPPLTFED
tara:strand:+ start:549 stop:662 length:114 start_codon:yes stop_codon:yes gene_type:complete